MPLDLEELKERAERVQLVEDLIKVLRMYPANMEAVMRDCENVLSRAEMRPKVNALMDRFALMVINRNTDYKDLTDSLIEVAIECKNNVSYINALYASFPGLRNKVNNLMAIYLTNVTNVTNVNVTNVIASSTPIEIELYKMIAHTDDSCVELVKEIFKHKVNFFIFAMEITGVLPEISEEVMSAYAELAEMAGTVVITNDLNELDEIRESLPDFTKQLNDFKARALKELRKAGNSEASRVLAIMAKKKLTLKDFQDAYALLEDMGKEDRVRMPKVLPIDKTALKMLILQFKRAVKG